jgi:hypothetical protein
MQTLAGILLQLHAAEAKVGQEVLHGAAEIVVWGAHLASTLLMTAALRRGSPPRYFWR